MTHVNVLMYPVCTPGTGVHVHMYRVPGLPG